MANPARTLRVLATCLALFAVAACTPFREGLPGEPMPVEQGGVSGQGAGPSIARDAMAQLGEPYRWGGSEPGRGFDCSGLVSFVHAQEGIAVPRTAAEQFAAARKLETRDLRPGDLVFFRLGGRDVSHVGIYTGDGRFVHAPATGRRVSVASLDDPFYRDRFAGAGRLYATSGEGPPRIHSTPK